MEKLSKMNCNIKCSYHIGISMPFMQLLCCQKETLDSLSWYLKNTGYRGTFNPSNGAINTLVSSSSFDIISNDQLRSILIQWKDLVADYLEDEAIADYHLVNFWDPYMNKKLLQRLN